MKQVKSIEHLKKLCLNNSNEFFIKLNYNARSSKYIFYNKDKELFYIINYIDDTEQSLSEEELFTESSIGEAITKGAFYVYKV
jgi:hypothetical protein